MNQRNNLNTVYYAFIFLFFLLVTGILGFVTLENFTFVEAWYMTIITMATVGFEEVHPLSNVGMLFTSFLIIFSFGTFAYVGSMLARLILDGEFRIRYKYYKINKKLEKISNHVIVCGYGRNGKQAVVDLLDSDEMVIVIEKDQIADELKHKGLLYLYGDATQDEMLEKAKISTAKALITSLPNDSDNLFIVLTARGLNRNMTIISRASDDHTDTKLKRAGANNVIMPDKVGGSRMAKLVSQPDILEFLDNILLKSGVDVNLVEIACKDLHISFLNRNIGDLNIRKISGANLIGLKNKSGTYIFNPSAELVLNPDDKLFAIGTPQQITKLKEVLTNS